MNLDRELSLNPIVISVLPGISYASSLARIMRRLYSKRICYVTLNKTACALQSFFDSHGVRTNKIFYIDSVSEGIGCMSDQNNAIFVSSPAALTELSIAISETLKSGYFGVVVFDSLSTLTIYDFHKGTAERFVSHFINDLKARTTNGVLTCLEKDMDSNLIRSSCLFVDDVFKISDFEKPANLGSTALSIFVAFVGMFWLLTAGSADVQVTGLAVADGVASYSLASPWLLFALLGLFLLVLFLISEVRCLKTVPIKKLAAIKPKKRSEAAIKKKVKTTLEDWMKSSQED